MKINSLEENLLRSLDGDLSAKEDQELHKIIDGSEALQSQWTELSSIKASLKENATSFDKVDLSARFEKQLAKGEEGRSRLPRRSFRQRRMWWFASVAMSLGLVFLWVGRTSQESSERGFRTKSASQIGGHQGAGFFVFKIGQSGAVESLKTTLGPDDDLAFAYINLGPQGFSHLMIFALDSSGSLHWMYPSPSEGASNPTSLKVKLSEGMVELPDQINSPFSGGTLRIFALFTNEALEVSAVEENMADFKSKLNDEWPVLGAGQHVLEKEYFVRGAK